MPTLSGKVAVNGVYTDGITVNLHREDTGVLIGQGVTGAPSYENPNQQYVQFHCHFDGANAATSAPDVSGKGRTLTFNNGAKLDTTWGAFGSPSSLKTGSGQSVTVASNPAFNVGAGDFEIFIAFRLSDRNSPGIQGLFNIGTYSAGVLVRLTTNGVEVLINSTTANIFAATITANTAYYLRVARESGVLRCYLNGSKIGSDISNSSAIPAGGLTIGVSAHNGSEYINGWVDEVRLTVGVAGTNSTVSSNLPDANSTSPSSPGTYYISTGYSGKAYCVALNPNQSSGNNLVKRISVAP